MILPRSSASLILFFMVSPTYVSLICSLEDDPSRVPAFYGQLRAAIRWLGAASYKTFDPFEKALLAKMEMRAQRVLERFRNMNAN